MNIAIIPARGGSKRIFRKNIRHFCGKPIVAYSILAAKESGCFDKIIVSTDDEEIAEVARIYGAETPFMRPPELSGDYIGTIPVIRHAIEMVERETSTKINNVCCIYATAPFIRSLDISEGLTQLTAYRDCLYAFSVTSYPFPIQRAIRVNSHHRVEMFDSDAFHLRSQDLEVAYHDAGQFYWGKREAWLEEKKIFAPYSIPIILPRYRVQDIDTQEDWECAELMSESIMRRE